ncbi:MAG: c-type cytochrome [Sulfurimonas sp.]|jgi:cytochrome c
MKTLSKTILTLGLLGATLLSADANFAKCTACHGANGEKHALGKSQVIQGWKAEKTLAALKGYKNGTYGGAMKGVMKGQVSKLTEADMEALAKHIEGLK